MPGRPQIKMKSKQGLCHFKLNILTSILKLHLQLFHSRVAPSSCIYALGRSELTPLHPTDLARVGKVHLPYTHILYIFVTEFVSTVALGKYLMRLHIH